jgi:hypothetical protein
MPDIEAPPTVPTASSGDPAPTILIVGASRGLGHAMAAEFLEYLDYLGRTVPW